MLSYSQAERQSKNASLICGFYKAVNGKMAYAIPKLRLLFLVSLQAFVFFTQADSSHVKSTSGITYQSLGNDDYSSFLTELDRNNPQYSPNRMKHLVLKGAIRDSSFFETRAEKKRKQSPYVKQTLMEKQIECASCREDKYCESGKCYFGRCVRSGVPQVHSVRNCFSGFNGPQEGENGEECSACKSAKECDSGKCLHGKCVYGGAVLHLSMLACFSDSYVHTC